MTCNRNYIDLLDHRRNEFSTLVWVSRELKPQIAFKQTLRPTPASHKDAVLASRKIQDLLDFLSHAQSIPKENLEAQVRLILDEIGYSKNLKLIRWLGLILSKICVKILTGFYVNSDIYKLKSLMGHCPVVFVPSHRSYADFILMSSLLFSLDFEIPAIAAGMDFHGMWGMGTMLRNTGAFFMRRSYNDDSLYWSTFKQYIYQLVSKGDLPIEFFIEGTRSRTGKSLTPKYGLMSMILKPFFLSEVPDIIFVPINISYDRNLEENLFAFELLGVPKPKETTSGFIKSLKILKENYGNIYFHFAEPISAKQFFGAKLDRSVHSLQPVIYEEITQHEKALISPLAHEIVHKQQKHCVVTIFNLIAIVLNANNCAKMSLSALQREVAWLKPIMESLGAFILIRKSLEESIADALDVHQNLVSVEDGQVGLVFNAVVLDQFNPRRFKGHWLSENTMSLAVPFIMLQSYVNPTLHYIVDFAILLVILKQRKSLNEDSLFEQYHFLRSLFSLEFVTIGAREQMEFQSGLEKARDLNLIRLNEDNCYELGDNGKLETVLRSCIEPYLVTYSIVLSVLQNVPDLCDEKTILKNVHILVENAINKKARFIHPYCLSLDSYSCCLNYLASQNHLRKVRRHNKLHFEIDKATLATLNNHLGIYLSMEHVEAPSGGIQLHLENKL